MILDWVPAHFPKDEWALARFDGTPLYEHADPRRGEQPDWGTLRLRLRATRGAQLPRRQRDATGSRSSTSTGCGSTRSPRCSTWTTRARPASGRPTSTAAARTSTRWRSCRRPTPPSYHRSPGIVMIAEESTAWPGVTRPTHLGGLGFGLKWNMGWMHDTLELRVARARAPAVPPQRDDVRADVRVERALRASRSATTRWCTARDPWCARCPETAGSSWPTCGRYLAYMWAHPGKQLLFMGIEFGQDAEWAREPRASTGGCSTTPTTAGPAARRAT